MKAILLFLLVHHRNKYVTADVQKYYLRMLQPTCMLTDRLCALHGRSKLRFVTNIEMSRKVCYLQLVRDIGEDNKLVIYATDRQ